MVKKNQVTLTLLTNKEVMKNIIKLMIVAIISGAGMLFALSGCGKEEPVTNKPFPVVVRHAPSAEYPEGVLELQYNKIKIKVPYSEVYSDVAADRGYLEMYFRWPEFSSGRNKMRTQEDYVRVGIKYDYKSKYNFRSFDDLQKDVNEGFVLPGILSKEFEGLVEYKRKSTNKTGIYQPDDLSVMKSYEGKPVVIYCDSGYKNYKDSVCRYQIYLSEDVSYIIDYRKDKLKNWRVIQGKVKNFINSIAIVEE